ncbi:pilus assembly protein TadG-related protein [Streptomyces sp. NPDC087270]|uniref:pilus assembly protein TadG-related protein n=1 Tax=Streptomyces sp. NPDC087270 TaxID=3365774 RepID=UPI0038150F15
MRDDRGQTVGIYIVAIAALFFLAFAYFAVGQAAVTRNGAQTAADSAALAAARQNRDDVQVAFLAALKGGDVTVLGRLLDSAGLDDQSACGAASDYADANHATVNDCVPLSGKPGYTITVTTKGPIGDSVIDSTKSTHAKATATAVVEPRCSLGSKDGDILKFSCDNGSLAINPKADDFTLDLSDFYSVRLTK